MRLIYLFAYFFIYLLAHLFIHLFSGILCAPWAIHCEMVEWWGANEIYMTNWVSSITNKKNKKKKKTKILNPNAN